MLNAAKKYGIRITENILSLDSRTLIIFVISNENHPRMIE